MTKKFENWDVKYQPTTIDEIEGQPYIQERLKTIRQRGDVPHLLFYGPPGVGKTSTAIAFAKDLFGSEWRYNFHSFNTSNTRGIDFIRSEIYSLVITVPVDAAYQIIFLDEADNITNEAQAALREIMQKHTATAKFIIACNDITKIIEPIQDRCKVLNFRPLVPSVIVDRLRVICAGEGVRYEEGVLEAIAKAANGSMRTAIHDVNFCYNDENYITVDAVREFRETGEQDMKRLFDRVLASDTSGCAMQLNNLYTHNNNAMSIFAEIIKMIDNDPKLTEAIKQDMIDQTGQYEWRISQKANEKLQMRCYLNSLCKCVKQS